MASALLARPLTVFQFLPENGLRRCCGPRQHEPEPALAGRPHAHCDGSVSHSLQPPLIRPDIRSLARRTACRRSTSISTSPPSVCSRRMETCDGHAARHGRPTTRKRWRLLRCGNTVCAA